ncbi:hypothetical protein GGP73_001198 [Salinibacter ruber]|nr:hypothetical protein [Salinibacter ruber]
MTADGSGSSDPDGDELTYNWSLTTPSDSETQLSDPSAVQPTFTPDVEGDYTVSLEVSDGEAANSSSADLSAIVPAVVIDEDIESDRTLSADTTYRIEQAQERPVIEVVGATITIEAGTEILFEEETGFQTLQGGEIHADGSAEEPITMAGASGNKTPGAWGINVAAGTNRFDHVRMRHAGGKWGNDSEERAGLVAGGISSSSTVEITNSTFEEMQEGAINIKQSASVSTPIRDNKFKEVGEVAVRVSFGNVGVLDDTNEFEEGSVVEAETIDRGGPREGVSKKTTVSSLGENAHYRIAGDPAVVGNGELKIEPGVEMRFKKDVRLYIDGGFGQTSAKVMAEGTASEPIVMAATEGNEQAGWWYGISFRRNYEGVFRHVNIRHGGARSDPESSGNIFLDAQGFGYPSSFVLENSSVEKSSTNGLACDPSENIDLKRSGNTFSGIDRKNVSGCE